MKLKIRYQLLSLALLLNILLPLNVFAFVIPLQYKVAQQVGKRDIDIFGFAPSKGNLIKGLVFVIPGTNGYSEPRILKSDEEDNLIAEQPSELAKVFLSSGYIYLTSNYRGMKPFHDCLKKRVFSAREFIQRCIDFEERKSLDFEAIESDIESAINFIKAQKDLNLLPLIVVAFSEGGVHTSRLVHKKKINPDGIIGIGVPTTSMRDNIKDQLSMNIQLRVALKQIRLKRKNEFCGSDLQLAMPYIQHGVEQILRENLFQICRNENEIQAYMQKSNDLVEEQIIELLRNSAPFGGSVFEQQVNEFIGFKWLLDALNDRESLMVKFMNYRKPTYFLYGEYDSTVSIHPNTICSLEKQRRQLCVSQFMRQLDHMLMNKNSKISNEALHKIIDITNTIVKEKAEKKMFLE